MKKAFTPDKDDPLKVRRNLALLTGLYSFFLMPLALIILTLCFGLPDTLAGNLLTYFGVLTVGPMGAYGIACHTADNLNAPKEGD